MRRHLCLASLAIVAGVCVAATALVAQPGDAPSKPPAKPAAQPAAGSWSDAQRSVAGQKDAPPMLPPPPTRDGPPQPPAASDESMRDPTQPQQPLADVYAMTKGAKNSEMPTLQLKGRIVTPEGAAALLGLDGQPNLLLVRAGVTFVLGGPKYAGMQVRVTKIDELGVYLAVSRLGQTQTEGQPIVLY